LEQCNLVQRYENNNVPSGCTSTSLLKFSFWLSSDCYMIMSHKSIWASGTKVKSCMGHHFLVAGFLAALPAFTSLEIGNLYVQHFIKWHTSLSCNCDTELKIRMCMLKFQWLCMNYIPV
jgi:hypothetical protein